MLCENCVILKTFDHDCRGLTVTSADQRWLTGDVAIL